MPTIINDVPMGSSLENLIKQFNLLVADYLSMKATFEAHTHGGITAGAGTSAVPSAAFITTGANAATANATTITLRK